METALNKARSNFHKASSQSDEPPTHKKTLLLPYSEEITTSTKSLLQDQINIIHSYPNTVHKKVVNVHQRQQDNHTPGVYCLPCKDCDLSYVGQTGRDLDTRLTEHKRAIKYAQENSAVFQHVSQHNHRIDWHKAGLVFKSGCSYRRKIIEASLIAYVPNFNLSKGQWSPDLITNLAVRYLTPKPFPPD